VNNTFRTTTVVATILVSFFCIAASQAQTERRGGGGQQGTPRYDTFKEITISGTVEKVEDWVQARQGRRLGGTHIFVGNGATYEIHIGPSSFLSEKNWSFSEGDEVQVTGSKVKWGGSTVLLAREIKRGKEVLALRNEQGIPLWSGGRRR
jgi:hypothetical protein